MQFILFVPLPIIGGKCTTICLRFRLCVSAGATASVYLMNTVFHWHCSVEAREVTVPIWKSGPL